MASRHVLDGFWDRKNVNGVNNNFVFLFAQISELLTNVDGISNDLATKVQTYENNFKYLFESVEKTLQISSDAEQAIQQAQEANAENKSVQKQIDQLIIDNGQSDAEVTQARVDINGVASDTLKARIDKVQTGVIDASQKSALYDKLYGTLTNLKVPSDLNIAVPFTVQSALNGDVQVNYDVGINKNAVTKRYYVDVKNGNNTNAGTESAPFQSINRAIRYGDADEIVVQEGAYGWTNGFSGFSQTKPFNLIGKGKVLIGAHRDGVTWNTNSTYSNVYQTNQTNVTEVVDYNNIDDIKFLTKRNSAQEVSDNAGSYYINSSNNIYVRTHDDRVPDDQILPNMFSDAVKITDNPKIYFENIRFTNSVKLTVTKSGNKFYAKDCYFSIGSGGNALSIEGYDYNILQSCVAKHATMDGFNYHVKNGILPKVIEIDCIGFDNGRNGADQNNGSTMHDGGQIIRIGGEYHNNGGPNVIDVNEGTVSVNIGVHSYSSRATTGTISNTSFKNGNVGKSKMYLFNCVSNDSDYSIVTATTEGSITSVENSLLLEPETTY
ncbi:hypothetical protein MNZ23_05490 [Staphylococcus equorum]|uniref:hypothetical protein n=1 Tax=Staphylococcus equorum TaxID=246432 RepID=UPI001F56D96D|nr:hypothetical protein [Staphylococcus equorum]UNP87055.1 hypothetical protein MNZ23_05490 [Staphylococcus equorum]